MIALDTNLLVRLVTADDAAQAKAVRLALAKRSSPTRPAYVDSIVLCEFAWVLQRSYGYEREDVCTALAAVASQPNFHVECLAQVQEAISLYRAGPADFSDYLMAAKARDAGFSPMLTLDKRAAGSAWHELLK
jgi:predicted nucleic-acid-binding protein